MRSVHLAAASLLGRSLAGWLLAGWLLAGWLLAAPLAAKETPPNIVLILADDLAWSDLGCYGHPWHRTPHLDRLAGQGLRMTQAYAPAPICSASRASVMTGKTTARLGFEFVTKNEPGEQRIDGDVPLRAPAFRLNLPLQETTLAEALAGLGYTTAFFGKWHLNRHHGRYLGWSPTHGPRQQGFQVAEQDFGAHPYGWKGGAPAEIDRPGRYADDSMVERACEFLAQPRDAPFFAFVSSFYVHTPVKTPCRWLLEEFDRIIPAELPNRQRRVRYAAFLQTLDHHVGQLLEALERSGESDRTLVVFLSDNGGHPEYTANAPLRGSKWNLYEGGVRVPLLVRWPGVIQPGQSSDVPVIGYDLLPTFVELAGGRPGRVDGVSLGGLWRDESRQGAGGQALAKRDLLWHFPYYHPERGYADAKPAIGINDFAVSKTRPQSALRRGQYKLLWFAEDDRVELYDLSTDPGEQSDLAARRPHVAQRLRTALMDRLVESQARMAEPVAAAR